MSDVEELAARRQALESLRQAGIDPYPPRASRTHSAAEALAAYREGAPEEEQPMVTVAGRMLTPRDMGKTVFVHLQDGTGKIQIYLKRAAVGEAQWELLNSLHPGDFVWATGRPFRTRTGEITVAVADLRLLAKALRPLPDKYHGITDKEVRYRKRYLDLISNRESFDVLMQRSRMVSAIRRRLEGRGFVEIESPVLQPLYGGAHARPFITHYNALGEDLYLRIALELYHKRLLVGGFDKLFEIGKVFRNEGLSRKHNPEFTMLELYWAYADYHDIMELVEWLVSGVAQDVLGSMVLERDGRQIDLTPPWPRLPLRQAILDATGIDFLAYPVGEGDVALFEAARARGLALPPGTTRAKVIDELASTFVEPKLIAPVFLYDYPVELSPLAKQKPGEPGLVERFEAFAGGTELANAFSELNDPDDQRRRFLAQAADRAAGDAEAHAFDEDFLEALEHGMPPAGGLGIGIDRLVMFLTGAETIKDVILFPQLRRGSALDDTLDEDA
jgi:lysyl-tRNA synthetase class 2